MCLLQHQDINLTLLNSSGSGICFELTYWGITAQLSYTKMLGYCQLLLFQKSNKHRYRYTHSNIS